MNPLRIGSLFSGYGGLDMAVQTVVGGQVVWHSDIKPASAALLTHRHPDIPNLGDMTRVFPAKPEIDAGSFAPIDVLAASWPCQPHSSAGKRLGEADPRALWPNVARAITEARPSIFFGENVARITSNGELRRVVRALADLGYVGAWRSVRASDIGACHRRDRCFIVAVDATAHTPRVGRAKGWPRDARQLGGPDAAVTLLPTPSASSYGTNQGGAAGRVGPVRESLDTMAKRGRFDAQLLPTPEASDSSGDSRNTRNATAGRSEGQAHHHAGWTLCDVAHADRWGIYAAAIHRHEQVFGRPAPEPTQLSLRASKPQLAPPFVEWMMGLPQGWVTDVPDLAPKPAGHRNAALSLLGDGVVPAQAVAAFSHLLAHLATVERAA